MPSSPGFSRRPPIARRQQDGIEHEPAEIVKLVTAAPGGLDLLSVIGIGPQSLFSLGAFLVGERDFDAGRQAVADVNLAGFALHSN
jgi:hypothetical protein